MASIRKTVTTEATVPVISLEAARLHLRVDLDDDDELITTLIAAATERAESFTNRCIMQKTIEIYQDDFPSNNCPILLDDSPVTSLDEIKYFDEDGVEQTFDTSKVKLDRGKSVPQRISLKEDEEWPSVLGENDVVSIKYTCGYATSTGCAPKVFDAAIKLMIGHWYENREEVTTVGVPREMPKAVETLLYKERILKMSDREIIT